MLLNEHAYTYIEISIINLSKTAMYDFWYDYVKGKYDRKGKPCYMDTDSFIIYVQTNDIYKDYTEDI